MRIWDVDPALLCRAHLLGEHRELHATWSILSQSKRGYAAHPEVKRWSGKLAALYARHEGLVAEMQRRGYDHRSPLDPDLARGMDRQDELLLDLDEQVELLRSKACDCPLEGESSPYRSPALARPEVHGEEGE